MLLQKFHEIVATIVQSFTLSIKFHIILQIYKRQQKT